MGSHLWNLLVKEDDPIATCHGQSSIPLSTAKNFATIVANLSVRERTDDTAILRTFALIVSAHPYCARKFTCHVMHRARALSTKMNNDRADGHCYGFALI